MHPHQALYLTPIRLFEGTKAPYIERLEDMRGMGRHTERDDIVALAEELKLCGMVALVAI